MPSLNHYEESVERVEGERIVRTETVKSDHSSKHRLSLGAMAWVYHSDASEANWGVWRVCDRAISVADPPVHVECVEALRSWF